MLAIALAPGLEFVGALGGFDTRHNQSYNTLSSTPLGNWRGFLFGAEVLPGEVAYSVLFAIAFVSSNTRFRTAGSVILQ